MVFLKWLFNFSMLSFYYSLWLGVLPVFVLIGSIWKIFINNNFFYYRSKPISSDLLNKVTVFKKLNYSVFIRWTLAAYILYFCSIYIYKQSSFIFFWNHLSCNNFKFWIFTVLVLISFFFIIFLKFFSGAKTPISIDFLFAISNLSAVLPLFFYVNTLYSFIFLLEVLSALIFYKFVASRIWNTEEISTDALKNKSFSRSLPKQYLDMLFFQFWATFFSTITLLISTLTLFYLFNTTDWVSMYYLISLNFELGYFTNSIFFTLLLIPLLLGIFLKLGLTPLHLYKIELYQGIPFKTIFFYTTYFFLTFVTFFSYFLLFLFSYTSTYWMWLLTIFFILGVLYATALLFDVNFIKAFFAYSTVINIIFSFLIIILFVNFY